MNILIVDDSKYLRTKLVSYLKNNSYKNIFEAGNELEAEVILKKYKIDLILLDIIMENEDSGLRILKKVRDKGSKTKVIIVSVVEHDKVLGEAMRLGANGYISKPVMESRLLLEINKVLKLK